MNDLLKYTDTSWHEVLTEQEKFKTPVREIPVTNLKRQNWESHSQFNKRLFYFEFGNNEKVIQAYERIMKYGYPKKCPIINKITNLIIF